MLNKTHKIDFLMPFVENQLLVEIGVLKIAEKLDMMILDFFNDLKRFPLDLSIKDNILKAFNLKESYWEYLKDRINNLINTNNLVCEENLNLDLESELKGNCKINEQVLKRFKFDNFILFDEQIKTKQNIFYYENLFFGEEDINFVNKKEKSENISGLDEKIKKFFDKLILDFKENLNKIKNTENKNNFSLRKLLFIKENDNEKEIFSLKNIEQELYIKKVPFYINLKKDKDNDYFIVIKDKTFMDYIKILFKMNMFNFLFEDFIKDYFYKFNDFFKSTETSNLNPYFEVFDSHDNLSILSEKNKNITLIFNQTNLSFLNDDIFKFGFISEIKFKISENEIKKEFIIENILGFRKLNEIEINDELKKILNSNPLFYLKEEFKKNFNKIFSNNYFKKYITDFITKNIVFHLEKTNDYDFLNYLFNIFTNDQKDIIYLNIIDSKNNINIFKNLRMPMSINKILLKNISKEIMRYDQKNNCKLFSFLKSEIFDDDTYIEICNSYNKKIEGLFFVNWNKNKKFVENQENIQMKFEKFKNKENSDPNYNFELQDLENEILKFEKEYNEKIFSKTFIFDIKNKIRELKLKNEEKLKQEIGSLSIEINKFIEYILNIKKPKDFNKRLEESNFSENLKEKIKWLKNWRNQMIHLDKNKKDRVKNVNYNEFTIVKNKFEKLKKDLEK
ncbi:RNA polymerase beta'' subunit family protein [Mycoplasmopsis cricetuli]|uniref:hypothetical protein n=1 Tax=Mycoplasmopsis cricetuli TaxID=171283 RepID=UPI0004707D08|nr:hypothetical protein [Mycoplasmopsis cricetuli]